MNRIEGKMNSYKIVNLDVPHMSFMLNGTRQWNTQEMDIEVTHHTSQIRDIRRARFANFTLWVIIHYLEESKEMPVTLILYRRL